MFEIGQRVYRRGNNPACGGTIAAIQDGAYLIEYDEGGSGFCPEDALAASVAEAVTAPIAEIKMHLIDTVASRRRAAEGAGVMIGARLFLTDAITQGKLTGAVVAAILDPAYSVNWKLNDGSFVTFQAGDLIAAGQAVRAHIQGCFDREKFLIEAIAAAGTMEQLAAIDLDSGWPA